MSSLTDRWRNASPIFRILLLLLLIMLLLLLCALLILQFGLPLITQTPTPTPLAPTPAVTTVAPTEERPTDTPTPTSTHTPVVTEEVIETETVEVTVAPTTATPERPIAPTEPITPTKTITPVIKIRNVLRNGSFEAGFQPNELGRYWKSFDNGSAAFSFHIDDWPLVVVEGKNTQLIEIKNAQLPDRYLGIYQTARVIPGEDYTFSMRGLIRTNTGDVEKTSYGYRLEVGFDLDGAQDWEKVEEWTELEWDEQLRVQDSFRFDEYTTKITAKSPRITVFIRAWKKWADSGEGDYDVDDIQLVGPVLVRPEAPRIPTTGEGPATIWDNVRVWATVALLLLLFGGALWKFGWKRT